MAQVNIFGKLKGYSLLLLFKKTPNHPCDPCTCFQGTAWVCFPQCFLGSALGEDLPNAHKTDWSLGAWKSTDPGQEVCFPGSTVISDKSFYHSGPQFPCKSVGLKAIRFSS